MTNYGCLLFLVNQRRSESRLKPHLLQTGTYSVAQVLSQAITEMKKNFYRDYFSMCIGMMNGPGDACVPASELRSRTALCSKGCYVVRLSKGTQPENSQDEATGDTLDIERRKRTMKLRMTIRRKLLLSLMIFLGIYVGRDYCCAIIAIKYPSRPSTIQSCLPQSAPNYSYRGSG